MAVFRSDQIEEMFEILETVRDRGDEMIERLIMHRFLTAEAVEFATHGLARRLSAITYSTARVFEEIPPDSDDVPSSDQRSEATAHLQTVAINIYGCFDNLARIWVAERDVKKTNGRNLSRGEIGFVAKCEIVRASLPEKLREQIAELDPWFSFLEDFRHATAHRVPLYIPPFMIDPRNMQHYRDFDQRAGYALRRRDFVEYERLNGARDALRHFRPMMATSANEPANALFHPQLLADFATVELWVGLVLDHLPKVETSAAD